MKDFDALAFEEKLLQSARHPVASYRYLAIEILGKLKSRRALPIFLEILLSPETDYYLLRQIIESTAKIPGDESRLLLKIAAQHRYKMISDRAKILLERVTTNDTD